MTTLAGTRVTLLPLTEADVEAVHSLWTDPAIRRFLFDDLVLSLDDVRAFVAESIGAFTRHGHGLWRVDEGGIAIGFAGFLEAMDAAPPSFVFGLAPRRWGRGLAAEAARLVLGHAFTALALPSVGADVDEPNTASVRLLERLGFVRERHAVVEGRPLLFYRLNRADWRP